MTAQNQRLTDDGPRLYGNWRAERGWGIGSLSTSSTILLFGTVLAPLLAVSAYPAAALPLFATSAAVIGAVVVRVGGVSLTDVVVRRLRFHRAQAAGWTELSGGVLTEHPRGADLPGVLAPLRPLDVDDGRGGRHTLLWHRRTGTLTAVLRCSPIGLDLADPDRADAWVAAWGALLADLGYLPLIRHLAVTVDTAPTGGGTVRDHIAAALDPAAPALARQIMAELADLTPATAAEADTRVSVCLDPSRATPRPADLLAAAVEVGRRLPAVENQLAACGVALVGRDRVDGRLIGVGARQGLGQGVAGGHHHIRDLLNIVRRRGHRLFCRVFSRRLGAGRQQGRCANQQGLFQVHKCLPQPRLRKASTRLSG